MRENTLLAIMFFGSCAVLAWGLWDTHHEAEACRDRGGVPVRGISGVECIILPVEDDAPE